MPQRQDASFSAGQAAALGMPCVSAAPDLQPPQPQGQPCPPPQRPASPPTPLAAAAPNPALDSGRSASPPPRALAPHSGGQLGSLAGPPPLTPGQILTRRIEWAAAAVALLMQLTIWMWTAFVRAEPRLTHSQHLHQAASVMVETFILVLLWRVPSHLWLRHRITAITIGRLAMALVPSNRAIGEGLAVLLDREATPGRMGALCDYIRAASGTRVLALVLAGVVLQQPPLAVLLQQSALMLLTSTNAYCSCRLLANPLSQRRMNFVWQLLNISASSTVPHPALAATVLSGSTSDLSTCMCLQALHRVVCGVLLPTVVAAHLVGDDGLHMERQSLAQEQHQDVQHSCSRTLRAAGRMWDTLNAQLQCCCCGTGCHTFQFMVGGWLLFNHSWFLIRATVS